MTVMVGLPGILLVLATAGAANAPRIAVVGLHHPSLPEKQQLKVISAIDRAVDGTGRADAVHGDELIRALSGREDLILKTAFLTPGRQAAEAGRLLYNQAQPSEAIPILNDAIGQLADGMQVTNAAADLYDAWLYRGVAHYQLDDTDEMTRSFQQAIALNALRSPNPARFPPDIIAQYTQVREAMQQEMGIITILSPPEGPATVYLNGQDRGETPLTIDEILPAENHLAAQTESGLRAYKKLVVAPSEARTVELSFAPASLPVGGETPFIRSGQTERLYRAVGEHASVDYVLLAGTDERLLYLQLYDPLNDVFSTAMPIPYSGDVDDEVVQTVPLLLNLLDGRGKLPGDSVSTEVAPLDVSANGILSQILLDPSEQTTVTDEVDKPKVSPWIYVASGVGVAALLGGATAFLLSSNGPPAEDPNQGTITVGPFD